MPPKKSPKGSSKETGGSNSRKRNGEEESPTPPDNGPKPPKRIDYLQFEHRQLKDDGSLDHVVDYNWKGLVRYLEGIQRSQRSMREVEKRHVDFYGREELEREFGEAEQAYRDARIVEDDAGRQSGRKWQKGKAPAVVAARTVRDNVKVRWDRVKKIKEDQFDREKREGDHEQVRGAQARLEDFLYYQEATRRWRRLRFVNPGERAGAEADRLARRQAWMINRDGIDTGHYDFLHTLLEYYDSRNIGGGQYFQGRHDHLGNMLLRPTYPPRVGPGELHLWTPRYRRWPSGLPRRINTDQSGRGEMINGVEQFEYDESFTPGDLVEPLDVRLDEEAVEHRRREVDSRFNENWEVEGLGHATHWERRQDDVALWRDRRPNTSNIRYRTVNGVGVTEDRWRHLQTSNGLFVAVKESSWDWLTSYDCLDKVKRSDYPLIFPTSAVREETDFGPDEEDDQIRGPDYPPEDDVDLEEIPEDPEPPVSEVPPPAEIPKIGEPAAYVDNSYKKRRANLTYPYPKNEFTLPTKRLKLGDKEDDFPCTEWAEETDGRREWHIYQRLSPSSDVDSPPRSPIQEAVIYPKSVPYLEVPGVSDVWRVVPDNDIPQLELKHRRCPIQPETCRAWWTHPREECVIVHSEKTQRPTNPAPDLSVIPPPKTQIIPQSGIANYNARLHDHYGIRQATEQVERWPKLGIRVPYEPMTFDANKLDPERPPSPEDAPDDTIRYPDDEAQKDPKKQNHIAKDVRKRAAYSMRALDMPLIKTCEPGVRNWGVVDADPTPPPPREEDAESDDEGDLFHDAYHQNDPPAHDPRVDDPPVDN
jgi:hypothetical protein